jgi:hypothetical protein
MRTGFTPRIISYEAVSVVIKLGPDAAHLGISVDDQMLLSSMINGQ